MNWLEYFGNVINKVFKWWFIVEPWETSIRIRFGKNVKELGEGIHFKLPFFDHVYIYNTRESFLTTQTQTLSTLDGSVLNVCGTLKYKIGSATKLHYSVNHPEDLLSQKAESLMADFVNEKARVEVDTVKLQAFVNAHLDLEPYGLIDFSFYITDFAFVRTYRLISGSMDRYRNDQNTLSTSDKIE